MQQRGVHLMDAWLVILLVILVLCICITPVVIDHFIACKKYKKKNNDVDDILNGRKKK